MWQLIVGLLLHFSFAFLLMYSFDEGMVWKDAPDGLRLIQPSIHDLRNPSSQVLDAYITQIICPSYLYFHLRSELIGSDRDRDWGSIGIGLILQAPTLLLTVRGFRLLRPTSSTFLCWAIPIAICCLGCFLLHLLYRHTLAIPPFYCDSDSLKKDSEHLAKFDTSYGESLDTALNHYVISIHLQYLLPLRKTIRTRQVIRRFLVACAFVAYALVYLPAYNP